MTLQEQIEALRKQLQQMDELRLEQESPSSPVFVRWREATKRQIRRIFGDESQYLKDFGSIGYISLVLVADEYRQQQIDREAFLRGLKAAKTWLLVMLDDLNERMRAGEVLPAPAAPSQAERPIGTLIQILQRFRECCQHLADLPRREKDVQDILWMMLRSHFDDLEREETLPRFGAKNYRPDFGLPDLRVLIEVKFIGEKTRVSSVQEEILGDLPGYLNSATHYDSVIVFIYDAAHKLRDPKRFVEDLKSIDGIIEVIVVPGLG